MAQINKTESISSFQVYQIKLIGSAVYFRNIGPFHQYVFGAAKQVNTIQLGKTNWQGNILSWSQHLAVAASIRLRCLGHLLI